MKADRADANSEPAKEVRNWNGIPLNISTRAGESRFKFAPAMSCDYGCIRGTWGKGLDGKALDVYVISDKPTVFRITQVTPDGAIDEYKYILGAGDLNEAVETFQKHVPKRYFGVAVPYSISRLQDDMQPNINKDSNTKTKTMTLRIYFTNRLDNDPEVVNLLTKILSSCYTSGIDRLANYGKTANENIVGEFEGDGTRFQYLINTKANTISYEAVKSRKDALPSRLDAAKKVKVGAQTAANKSGKKLTCTPGKTYPCGAVCRAMNKPCKQPMNLQTQAMTKQAVAKIEKIANQVGMKTAPVTVTTANKTGYSRQQIEALAEQLKGEKPNLIPVYVKLLNSTIKTMSAEQTAEQDERDRIAKQKKNRNESIFTISEFQTDETSGQVFRGVTKLIKNKEDKPDARYEYEAVLNGHILEASRLAKNDFIKIMIIDDEMEKQLKLESGGF